ncbi:hypothetical protein BDQ17DRAFT_1333684 [Cyathus striatus]|nr:hypothetical protein BDQ17DRAFT_1333684 [Cyathus striatus]
MLVGDDVAVHYTYDLVYGTAVYFIAHCPKYLIQSLGKISKTRKYTKVIRMEVVYGVHVEASAQWADQEDLYLDLNQIHAEATYQSTIMALLNDLEYQFRFIKKMAVIFRKAIRLRSVEERNRLRNEINSTLESLEQLQRRIQTMLNWTRNFRRRLDIRINLEFNRRAQLDSQTNLKIEKLTTDIAVDAQRDSASMITIAAVTMFFLPGTFVCAVFSMVFFNDGMDSSGRDVFSVSKKWWYFLAATFPLTIAVFSVWWFWTKRRTEAKASALKFEQERLPHVDFSNK